MLVTKTVKLPNGAEFTANLTEDQLSYLLSVGINYLFQRGALPFALGTEQNMSNFAPAQETEQ